MTRGAIAGDPAVAYNDATNQFAVVWEALQTDTEIFGRRVPATGEAPFEPADVPISDQGGSTTLSASNPDIVHNANSNEFMVVWQGEEAPGQLAVTTFSPKWLTGCAV